MKENKIKENIHAKIVLLLKTLGKFISLKARKPNKAVVVMKVAPKEPDIGSQAINLLGIWNQTSLIN